MVKFEVGAMRERFAELQTLMTEVDAEIAPLQEEQAEIANYKRDREIELNEIIKEVNVRRGEISNEMGLLARALGGRIMSEGSISEEEAE